MACVKATNSVEFLSTARMLVSSARPVTGFNR
jgi:hypothetical protein